MRRYTDVISNPSIDHEYTCSCCVEVELRKWPLFIVIIRHDNVLKKVFYRYLRSGASRALNVGLIDMLVAVHLHINEAV